MQFQYPIGQYFWPQLQSQNLILTVVREPASLSSLVLGAMGLLARRR